MQCAQNAQLTRHSEKNNRTSKSSCKVSAVLAVMAKHCSHVLQISCFGQLQISNNYIMKNVKASKALNMGSDVVESSSARVTIPKDVMDIGSSKDNNPTQPLTLPLTLCYNPLP